MPAPYEEGEGCGFEFVAASLHDAKTCQLDRLMCELWTADLAVVLLGASEQLPWARSLRGECGVVQCEYIVDCAIEYPCAVFFVCVFRVV